jgi:hypothetical protein
MSNTGVQGISWGIHDGKVRIQITYWDRKNGISYRTAIYSDDMSEEADDKAFEKAKQILKEFKNK